MGIKTPSETRAIIEGRGREPYHPINDKENMRRYEKYRELAAAGGNVTSGGRQGQYKYYDMDKVIAEALKRLPTKCNRRKPFSYRKILCS